MRLTVETEALATALRQASTCAKKVDGVLGHVLLEAADGCLTLSAMDMVREVKVGIPAQVSIPGSRTARASLLAIMANSSRADIHIEFDGSHLRAKSGRSSLDIPSLDPDIYRGMPLQLNAASFTFANSEFQRTLSEVAFCANEASPVPSGQGINVYPAEPQSDGAGRDWVIWASDGKKMMEVRLNAPSGEAEFQPFIYPIQSAKIAAALFPSEVGQVEVSVSRSMVAIVDDHASFVTTLLDGKMSMGYRNWLAPGPHVVKADREELLSSIGLVSAAFENVGISCSDGMMRLHTRNTDTSAGSSELAVEGELPFSVTVDAPYLMAVLRALKGSQVSLRFADDQNRPFLVQDGREGVTCVVAPLSQLARAQHAA